MRNRGDKIQAAAASAVIILPALAWWTTRGYPAWVNMWVLAGSEFFALKLVTLTAVEWRPAAPGRIGAYLVAWPGMDARAFLFNRADKTPGARPGEMAWALLKLAGGLLACLWAVRWVNTAPALLVGWVGMIGIIFVLHFGLLHVISWCWRRAGVNAPPIMRAPILADSLAAFWGGRWNAAFADAARRLLLRPLARPLGVNTAGALVFLVSGLVHETVISLPARGGWGGPTAYFLLQGAGTALEKSAPGKHLGLGTGMKGWVWMAFCTAGPLPLLLHAPFIHRVIVPMLQFFNQHIP